MILVKLNQFPETMGLEHISTTFRLYRDPDLNVLIDEQIRSNNKDLYFYPVTLPKDAVYYLKYTRHFNDNEADITGDIIEVYDNGEEFSEMLLQEDIIVEEPTVDFDRDSLLNKDILVITCSKFRSNYGEHEYTNWIILDSTDKVLFSSLRDTVNKESIKITNTYDFINKTTLKVIVSHGTFNNIESKPVIFEIRNGFFNFEILTNLKSVPAYRNLDVKFKQLDGKKPLGIYKIELRDTKDDTLWFTVNSIPDDLTVALPWYIFRDNTDINMVIEASDTLGGYHNVIKKITTQSYQTDFIRNPDKKYERVISKAIRSQVKIPNYITTGPINEKLLAIPNPNTFKLDCYEFDTLRREFINRNKHADGINLFNSRLDGLYISVYNNEYLLIDGYSSDGNPTFYIYRHIIQTNTYSLVQSLERPNETKSLGYTNAITQITYKDFLYIPVGSRYFYKYDILENELIKLGEIPLKGKEFSFIRLTKSRVLVIGGDDYSTTIYDYSKNSFMEGVYVRPESFIKNKNITLFLDNGDSIIFKTIEDDLLETSILYHELGGSKLEPLSGKFNHMFPKSTIRLNNGDVIMGVNDPITGGVRPDRPDIGDDGIIIPDLPGVDGPVDETWNVLIVNNGEDILVNDLKQYDLIHIKGTGRLTYVTDRNVRTFNSRSYIATRSRSFKLTEFMARKYKELHILDGVDFKLVDDKDINSDLPITDPSHPDYVAPDDTSNPSHSIFYIFK